MKICKKCKLEKELNCFNTFKTQKSPDHEIVIGYVDTCKECRYGYKPHTIPDVEKECTGCEKTKSINEFGFTNRTHKYRFSQCRPCRNKHRESLRKANPLKEKARNRNRRLKSLYGITTIEYNQMFLNQEGKCGSCKRENLELVVDHDHKTGKIRELLCNDCNIGIGHFKDNVELLKLAVEYLIKHSQQEILL